MLAQAGQDGLSHGSGGPGDFVAEAVVVTAMGLRGAL